MFASSVISLAKIWLTVCVAVMISFATVTPDIHPVEQEEVVCQDDVDTVYVMPSDQKPGQPVRAPHEHHAHNCGSCHIHATSLQFSSVEAALPAKIEYNSNVSDVAPRAGPTGLFRPPRV